MGIISAPTGGSASDSSLAKQPQILINAGRRGLQLKMVPQDLIAFCRITLGDIT